MNHDCAISSGSMWIVRGVSPILRRESSCRILLSQSIAGRSYWVGIVVVLVSSVVLVEINVGVVEAVEVASVIDCDSWD